MKRYWLQNVTKGFETLITKFIECLHERGHVVYLDPQVATL